ncbi:hypothetical protein LIER_07659 [Lithospermum erythrorhizon]|uniref:Retrotransposon Copia-like N-terminal domain-containing protein n=1 Tax=Lithospermum erythrorhizon TaxID=34254 RepID=A0AAV3P929_LITER
MQNANDQTIRVDNPLYLHSFDHSSLVLVTDLLTEHNYTPWSRSMMIALEARDKLSFVNGENPELEVDHYTYRQWRKVNSTIISWILNALTPKIGRGYVFADNACDLWREIKESFGKSNGPKVYELRRRFMRVDKGMILSQFTITN